MVEGWTWSVYSNKWHYVVDGESLCRRLPLLGNPGLEQGNDNSADNCELCVKALAKRRKEIELK